MAKTVKFFVTPVYPYGNDHYFHEIIAIAEGFKELGWKVIGNCNYWFVPEDGQYLLKEDNDSKEYELEIYDYRYARSFEHLLFREGFPNFDKHCKHVLVDRNDWLSPIWLRNPGYKVYDLICAGNLYKNYSYPGNVKPWAIGLTNRIIKYIDQNRDAQKKKGIGFNFRVDHNMRGYVTQHILDQAEKKQFPVEQCLSDNSEKALASFSETDLQYRRQSTRRHDPAYFRNINSYDYFLAFGGYYEYKPLRYQPYRLADKIARKPAYYQYKKRKAACKDFSDLVFVFQQDNFRFWETLYSNTAPVNLDLQHWNFWLPEMPKAGETYVGIKDLSATGLVEKLTSLSETDKSTIAMEGKNWVHQNYSPAAQARRVLSYLNIA